MTRLSTALIRYFAAAAATGCLTTFAPVVKATDANAASRALQQFGQGLLNIEADNRRREQFQERQRETEQQRKDAQQRLKNAQQLALQGEQNSHSEAERVRRSAGQTPPEQYDGRIVARRNALRVVSSDVPPAHQFSGLANFSPDGTKVAWIDERQGVLKLYDFRNQTTRDIRNSSPDKVLTAQFLGNEKLVIETRSSASSKDWVELIDLEGRSVRRWAPESRGSVILGKSVFAVWSYGDKGKRITEAIYDAAGAKLSEADLRAVGAEVDGGFAVHYDLNSGHEVLARREYEIFYFRDGQLVRRFTGDIRRDPSNEFRVAHYHWPKGSGHAISTFDGDNRFMTWNPAEGRMQCSGTLPASSAGYVILFDATNKRLYSSSPPAIIDPETCVAQALGGQSDRLTIDKEHAFLTNAVSGRVSVLDAKTMQIKYVLETGLGKPPEKFGTHMLMAIVDKEDPSLLAVTDSNWGKAGKQDVTQLYDLSTRQLIGRVPAWTTTTNSEYAVRHDFDQIAATWTTRLWQRSSLFDRRVEEFLKSAAKNTLETTEAWRKRVSGLRLPYRMKLDLGSYDADAERFQARFHETLASLPMPPEIARSLDGRKTVEVSGALRPLDADFVELADPQLVMPDGAMYPLAFRPCVDSLNHLKDTLRAYRHPLLARLRGVILATSISSTLERANEAGFTRKAAAAATSEQAAKFDREAEIIASSADEAVVADLRRVDAGTLPLNYVCEGTKNEKVCRYIEQGWRARAAREVAKAMACKGQVTSR